MPSEISYNIGIYRVWEKPPCQPPAFVQDCILVTALLSQPSRRSTRRIPTAGAFSPGRRITGCFVVARRFVAPARPQRHRMKFWRNKPTDAGLPQDQCATPRSEPRPAVPCRGRRIADDAGWSSPMVELPRGQSGRRPETAEKFALPAIFPASQGNVGAPSVRAESVSAGRVTRAYDMMAQAPVIQRTRWQS
jgi:hypothetical protein